MRIVSPLICLAALLLAGCKDDGAGRSTPPAGPVFSPPEVVLPAKLAPGWRNGPESARRSASYVLEGEGGSVADVSLLILPGQPGGLLSNVNSWRKQLGQPPLDQNTFELQGQWTTTPVGEGAVIDITGAPDSSKASFDGRLVAVVCEQPTRSWFFKMRGNAELVAAHRSAFLEWIHAVKPAGEEGSAPTIPPEPAPDAPCKHPAAGAEPTWQVPDHWERAPEPATTFARFTITTPEGRTGEVSVLLLEGNGGETLANVNRWRQQAGLPPTAKKYLAERIQSVFSSGTKLSILQLAGPKCSTMAGWVTRSEGTWFFKLTGPASVVEAERPQFAAFLRTISFPKAHPEPPGEQNTRSLQ